MADKWASWSRQFGPIRLTPDPGSHRATPLAVHLSLHRLFTFLVIHFCKVPQTGPPSAPGVTRGHTVQKSGHRGYSVRGAESEAPHK